jgi:coenzyme F420 hydrogenase subunit beta
MKQDPVCGANIPESTPYRLEYGEREYFFCSSECMRSFKDMKKSVIRLKNRIDEEKRLAFGKLRKDIIKPGICTMCGACAATCESIEIIDSQPRLVGPCNGCGVCYIQCPRTITTEEDLIAQIRFAYAARSKLKDIMGQDGGVVTALLAYALEEGLIDCAVVSTRSEDQPWKPVAIVAESYKDLLKSSGSIYSHSMTIKQLMESIQKGRRSIAFVGPSCNIDAVYKMQKSPHGFLHLFMRAHVLRLGLFCMDTFSYEGIKEFSEKHGLSLRDIEGMKIRKGIFEFETKEGVEKYPLSEFDEYRSSSCKYCTDMAAENSDISFGGVGSPDGYTTVLARTSIGYEIFNEAISSGFIEASPLTAVGMERVLHLAKLKKVQMYGINRRNTKNAKSV